MHRCIDEPTLFDLDACSISDFVALRPCIKTSNRKFYIYYRDKFMILYYFPIPQNTINKTVSDFFQEMYMLVYVCAHILLFFYLLV